MKYYSEITREFFNSEKELNEAEAAHEKKVAEAKQKREAAEAARKERAKEVEEALKDLQNAQKHYIELRNKFIKDYGSWHMTISSPTPLTDLVEALFSF